MSSETVKIRWYVSTDRVGSECSDIYDTGMTPSEWAELDDDDKDEIMREVVFQFVEWGYSEVED